MNLNCKKGIFANSYGFSQDISGRTTLIILSLDLFSTFILHSISSCTITAPGRVVPREDEDVPPVIVRNSESRKHKSTPC